MAGGDKYPSSYTNSLIRKDCLSMVLDRYLFWITHPTRYSWVHNPKERQCLIIFFFTEINFFSLFQNKKLIDISHLQSLLFFWIHIHKINKAEIKKRETEKGRKKITFLMGSFMLLLLLFFHRNNVHLYNTVVIYHESCLLLHSSKLKIEKNPAIFVEYFLQKQFALFFWF